MTPQDAVDVVDDRFEDWWTTHERRPLPSTTQTVADLVDACADQFGDRVALRAESEALSYRELGERAAQAAQALADLGLRRGDRLAASADNDADLVLAFLGAMRLGLVWVGINRAFAPAEMLELLADCDARQLLASGQVASSLATFGELPNGCAVLALDEWRRAVDQAHPYESEVPVDPFAPAAIAYTSGTTGRPKGVVHSQRNMLLPGIIARRRNEPFTRRLCVHPLTILNIAVVDLLAGMFNGMTTSIMDWSGAEKMAEIVERDRIETARLAPPMAYDLLSSSTVSVDALASLVNPIVGGGDLPESFVTRFAERFGSPPRGAYGLTEAMNGCARERSEEQHIPGCSGPAYEHLELTIRGDDGRVLGPDETGELCVGPVRTGELADVWTPMIGYWRQPEATREVLRGGVLHTGDVAKLDDAGRLYVVGRIKDTIVRGGANVSPGEVERVLATHPGVAESVVLGKPDERLGQEVVAVVRRSPHSAVTETELIAHCRVSLARYKTPTSVKFVDQVPHTPSGKVAKAKLAALFIA